VIEEYNKEVEDLKDKLDFNFIRDSACKSEEVAPAKAVLTKHKLSKLEAVISQQAARSDYEKVRREVSRLFKELSRVGQPIMRRT
jgi:hypothetical protein